MEKIKSGLDKLLEVLCTVIFIAMVVLTTYQVVVRYVFDSPSSISETLTRYLFVWLILLSAAYIFGKRDHICIAFLKDKLSGKPRQIVESLIEIITIFFAVVILIYGGGVITQMNMLQYDSILKIPTGIIYSVIPACGVLILFYSILNIAALLKQGRN